MITTQEATDLGFVKHNYKPNTDYFLDLGGAFGLFYKEYHKGFNRILVLDYKYESDTHSAINIGHLDKQGVEQLIKLLTP